MLYDLSAKIDFGTIFMKILGALVSGYGALVGYSSAMESSIEEKKILELFGREVLP